MSNNKQKREFRIHDDVKTFASLTMKKYKKKYANNYDSKKEQKKGYYEMLIGELPEVIKLLVNYSHVQEVKDIKADIYQRLFDKDLIKKITKKEESWKNDPQSNDRIENIELLPIIIYDVIREATAQHMKEKEEDPDVKEYYLEDLLNLSNLIMKKKMKKLKKVNISSELAFDCLSVIPTSKVLERGIYRLKMLMQVIYTHSKTEDVDFEKIAKYVVTPSYYPSFITYLLLERKSEFVNMDEKQKEFFNSVTEWAFNTMEKMDKVEINQIFRAYFEARKKDKKNNKDSNRRFFLGSIPESDFPNLVKVLNKIKESDPSVEEFM